MKTNLVLALLAAATLSSCDNKKTSTDESATTTQDGSPDAGLSAADMANSHVQCYAMMTDRDTVLLNVTQKGLDVSGTLQYRLAEKDQNSGTLRGKMRGDTLTADYTFQSEGKESVREVVFVATKNGLVEGYGPVQEQNGKMVFTPNQPLTFQSDQVFKRIPCHDDE